MRIKVAVAAILGLLVFVGVVGVASAHKLPFSLAKTEIKRLTADICGETEGCRNWRVTSCRRRSLHRVDCVSQLFLSEGGSCAWVTIARAPKDLYEVRLHHKRIFC
jgi:hypothetical protein